MQCLIRFGKLSMDVRKHEAGFKDYLTIAQAAAILGVSTSTLRNWDRQGKVKAYRHPINGYRLYAHADLMGLLHEITEQDSGKD